MTMPRLTLAIEAGEAPAGRTHEIVLDDDDSVRFLLNQPDPGAALRDSLRLGLQSLRLAAQPWPERESGAFRRVA